MNADEFDRISPVESDGNGVAGHSASQSVPALSDSDLQHLWAARWEPAHAKVLWHRITEQRTSSAALTNRADSPGMRSPIIRPRQEPNDESAH
ncbi:MAG TPA: hypothetical protein VHV82_13360 [Sporichthyaceae bacterium]|jgi:hypothetical protein|nr:hypothetical protein [Sporichthyaceae bacterium]